MNVSEIVEALQNWLHVEGVDFSDEFAFIDAYCNKTREFGLPVDRVFIATSILHPLVATKAFIWKKDEAIRELSFSREEYRQFQTSLAKQNEMKDNNSPMYQIMVGAKAVRIHVDDEDLPPDVDWMPKEGFTDLFGLPVPGQGFLLPQKVKIGPEMGGDRLEGGFTWSTKQEGGFTEDQIEALEKTVGALSVVLRIYILRFSSRYLLQAYLGEDAGSRVHRGEIERGEGLTIRSVIWFSDVRGFTKMSGELHRSELIDIINGVFEVTQKVVRKHKGQVLKFMGDGCMVIFSSASSAFQRSSFSSADKRSLDEEQGAETCHRARMAAFEVHEELETLKKEREAKSLRGASIGVGLHYGDVSYGNVGAPDRLDFTVLGPHVNLASRTESLCSKLGAKVLATGDFVKLDDSPESWIGRGEHQVKGVEDPVPIFELSSELNFVPETIV